MSKYPIILTAFLLVSANLVCAAENIVVINEIAWMGTLESANDEWLELKNSTDQEIDLTGWTLKAQDDTPNLALTGSIPAQGYFLLERTDDETVAGVTADQIYTGALGNSGEILELRDATNNLIDSVSASEDWPAGNNDTKQTMERKTDNTWQTSLEPDGTPKAQNSLGASDTSPQIPPEPAEPQSFPGAVYKPPNRPPKSYAGFDIVATLNQEIEFSAAQSSDPDNDTLSYFWNFGDGATDTQEICQHTYTYPGKYLVSLMVCDGTFCSTDIIEVMIVNLSVVISEFMPKPVSSGDFEWIELYNTSLDITDLSDWQLSDSGNNSFVFPPNTLVMPNEYLVIKKEISQISLNNDGDIVMLFYPDGSLASQISYASSTPAGLSVALDGINYFWTKTPTPGLANIITTIDSQKEFLSNNPQPIIVESLQSPNDTRVNTLSTINNDTKIAEDQQIALLNEDVQSSQFVANALKHQTVALGQTAQSSDKPTLILFFTFVISGSLFSSWLIILARRKFAHTK